MKKAILGGLGTAAMIVFAGFFAGLGVPSAFSADSIPAVVFGLGGKFDKSFNESAYKGAERFKKETGVQYRSFEIQNASQREQAYRRFARDGNNPIIAMGFASAEALRKVAREFPDVNFAIVDTTVDEPNIRSIVYKAHEGSFLVGVAAAKTTKTGKIGFIGGMDIPLIRQFACGYIQGARFVNPDVTVLQNMTGTTGEAWSNPVKGGELARSQMDQGADVIFTAAGATGLGVLQAVADAGKLGIGVDTNQNYLHPGHVLTSMVKRIDVAVYNAFMDARNNKWTNGIVALGLGDDGVGYAVDEYNMALVNADMKKALEKAEKGVVSGSIKVHNYMSDDKCPVR